MNVHESQSRRLSCGIVERKPVFTRRKVLNERSASQDITGSTMTPTNIYLKFEKVTAIAHVERQLEVCWVSRFQHYVNTKAQASAADGNTKSSFKMCIIS